MGGLLVLVLFYFGYCSTDMVFYSTADEFRQGLPLHICQLAGAVAELRGCLDEDFNGGLGWS